MELSKRLPPLSELGGGGGVGGAGGGVAEDVEQVDRELSSLLKAISIRTCTHVLFYHSESDPFCADKFLAIDAPFEVLVGLPPSSFFLPFDSP